MRDPKRIKKVMELVERIWNVFPDWRFGQLVKIVEAISDVDIFYVEDDEMIRILKEVEKNLDN